jgi:hypothetical protein
MSDAAVSGAATREPGAAVRGLAGGYARRLVADGLRLGDVPRLHLVPRPVRGAPRAPFVALILGLLGAGMLGLLLLNTTMQQRSFALHDLESSNELLAEQVEVLRDDLDAREAPGGLAEQAWALGMVPAGATAFLDVRTGEIRGEAAPSGGDSLLQQAKPKADPAAAAATLPVQPAPVPKPTPSPTPAPPAQGAAPGATTAPEGGAAGQDASPADGAAPAPAGGDADDEANR